MAGPSEKGLPNRTLFFVLLEPPQTPAVHQRTDSSGCKKRGVDDREQQKVSLPGHRAGKAGDGDRRNSGKGGMQNKTPRKNPGTADGIDQDILGNAGQKEKGQGGSFKPAACTELFVTVELLSVYQPADQRLAEAAGNPEGAESTEQNSEKGNGKSPKRAVKNPTRQLYESSRKNGDDDLKNLKKQQNRNTGGADRVDPSGKAADQIGVTRETQPLLSPGQGTKKQKQHSEARCQTNRFPAVFQAVSPRHTLALFR